MRTRTTEHRQGCDAQQCKTRRFGKGNLGKLKIVKGDLIAALQAVAVSVSQIEAERQDIVRDAAEIDGLRSY